MLWQTVMAMVLVLVPQVQMATCVMYRAEQRTIRHLKCLMRMQFVTVQLRLIWMRMQLQMVLMQMLWQMVTAMVQVQQAQMVISVVYRVELLIL